MSDGMMKGSVWKRKRSKGQKEGGKNRCVNY